MSSRFFLCVPGLFSHSSTRHHADPILRLPRPDLTGAVKRGPHVRGRQAMATAATTTSSTATTTTTTCSSPSSTTSPIHPAVPHRRRLNDIERVDYAHGAAADDCAACGGVAPTPPRGRRRVRPRAPCRRGVTPCGGGGGRRCCWRGGSALGRRGGRAGVDEGVVLCLLGLVAVVGFLGSHRRGGSGGGGGGAGSGALARRRRRRRRRREARQEGGGGRRRRDGVDGGEPDGSHAPPARPAGAYVHSPLITRSTLTSLDRHSFITKII